MPRGELTFDERSVVDRVAAGTAARCAVPWGLETIHRALLEPLEARTRTNITPVFFMKVPRYLPRAGGWARVSMISVSHVTSPARDWYNLNNPTCKINNFIASSERAGAQGRSMNCVPMGFKKSGCGGRGSVPRI